MPEQATTWPHSPGFIGSVGGLERQMELNLSKWHGWIWIDDMVWRFWLGRFQGLGGVCTVYPRPGTFQRSPSGRIDDGNSHTHTLVKSVGPFQSQLPTDLSDHTMRRSSVFARGRGWTVELGWALVSPTYTFTALNLEPHLSLRILLPSAPRNHPPLPPPHISSHPLLFTPLFYFFLLLSTLGRRWM